MPKGKTKTENAITMLKEDHKKVKKLFDDFEESDSTAQSEIVATAINELKIHATIEEKLFYPSVRQALEEDEEGIMPEADEEHHVAKLLIAELEQMKGDEEHWEAKFKVLAESVRHHIKEEEGTMFPKARKTEIDFAVLGRRMSELKAKLQQEGVPTDAETEMIAKCGLRGDSPAAEAQKTIEVPLKTKRPQAA